MERFLRYALEKSKKIRVVYMLDGHIQQKTVTVLAFNSACATFCLSGKKAPFAVPLGDILSCDYARGDHGEE